ncbi:hypothetical protein HDU86_000898 [Geranomyces michiganensis]|nr:hypothetical protein HDU86_000898 [Geranomyces michiganensis]
MFRFYLDYSMKARSIYVFLDKGPTIRSHALLGQDLIPNDAVLIQHKDLCLCLVLARDEDWAMLKDVVAQYDRTSYEMKDENFSDDEFECLEDDDHDSDDPGSYELQDGDYIDEVS